MKIRVADVIAQYLENLGVERAFMLSGGGMMHLQDALSRQLKLKYICNHHEQAAGFAAEAYGRQRESLGVCYATSGPGAANTVTSIVSAYQDSSPVVFLGGQAKLSETIRGTGLDGLRQFGTFEVDVVSIVQSITKYAVFLNDASKVRYHIEKACELALTGRPGPVFIEVPVDIQGALVDPDSLVGYLGSAEHLEYQESLKKGLVPTAADVQYVLDKLKTAQRPLIFAGHGVRCAQSTSAFLTLVEKLGVPVATSSMAADLMPFDHPLYVGHPGVKGDRAGNFAIQSADVVLILGCSLHSMNTGYELDRFAPNALKIQVEMDPLVLKRENVGVRKKIQAGQKEFIAAALNELETTGTPSGAAPFSEPTKENSPWRTQCKLWKQELMVRNEPHKRNPGGLNYYDVIETLSNVCKGGETIVADAGSAFYITGQAFRTKPDQRVIFCGALAQMGYTLPGCTGAAFGAPERTVIGVTGDGSLQTNIHELAVIKFHQLNVKLLVVNNQGYSCIRNTQKNYFGAFYSGTDVESGVGFPDLSKLCDAYGIAYRSESRADHLENTMKEVLAMKGPVVFEVSTIREQEFLPTVSSVRLANGKMQSKPLHEMYPFMDEATLDRFMPWK